MTLNVRLNRETVSMVAGAIVLTIVFVMLMWFPSAFFSFVVGLAWFLMVFAASAVIGGLVMLGIYNLLGKVFRSEELDEEED